MNTYKITETKINTFNNTEITITKKVEAKDAASALWENDYISSCYVKNTKIDADNAYVTWAEGTKTAYAEEVK